MTGNRKYKSNAERVIGEYLYKKNEEESKKHERSGKISPSKLAYTTLEAVLSLLGTPTAEFNHTVLGIFERGKTIENTVYRAYQSKGGYGSQQPYEYRGGSGYADLELAGDIIEIKSVGSRKFWKIQSEKTPQLSHAVQLAYYLAARGHSSGRLNYVCADNLQAVEIRIYLAIYKPTLDYRIDAIHHSLANGRLPDWLALEDWHKNKLYAAYPEFWGLKGAEAEKLLRVRSPEAYKRLKSKELAKLCDKQKSHLIHSLAGLSTFWNGIGSHATMTTICGVNCVMCSIRRLNTQLEVTEKSRLYFVPCQRSTILDEPDVQSMLATIT